MARYRSRSRSYTPHRSRSPIRRRRLDDRSRPSRSYRDRRSPAPSGLLVRNIALDARPEDLRVPFERFGPVKDVYLPKNYYTGEPRGFGFVKFRNGEDAAEAKHHLNHTVIGGREIAIVFAEENRKTPQEMRSTSRVSSSRYGGSYRRRSPARSPRRRYRSYSRSPSPVGHDSRGRDRGGRDYYSPSHSRSVSRSVSPREGKRYKSNHNSKSPRQNDQSPHGKRDLGSEKRSSSPMKNGKSSWSPSLRENDHHKHGKKNQISDRRSPSPRRCERSLSRPPSRSRSYSPR